MIEYVQGKLADKKPTQAVVDINGLGYQLMISVNTFDGLPAIGESVSLKTYLHVREDAMQLFGFADEVERTVFLGLISVSGVGPKLAQGILSGIRVSELIDALRKEDVARLPKISGVGKKTAQRLVIELKEKFAHLGIMQPDATEEAQRPTFTAIEEEVLMAMISLGYTRQSAERALQKVHSNEDKVLTVQELIKKALQAI